MRKMLLVLSLTGLAIWADASDAFAQVYVRRGGNIVYGDGYGNYGYGGSYLPFGGAFLPFGGANLPNVYTGGPEYGPNYQGYGYGYAPNYYDGTPMRRRQTYYAAPVVGQPFARMTVLVPTADTQVWFQNQETTQFGMRRSFDSPPLAPNQDFTYTVKARWTENGKTFNQERQVHFQAGQNVTVDFRSNSLPQPLSQVPATTSPN